MHLLNAILLATLTITVFGYDRPNNKCNLSKELIEEIRSYEPQVNRIMEESLRGKFKGFVYKELSMFVDKFIHRIPGSKDLDDAIEYMLTKLKSYELDNVHGEEVTDIPTWERGKESATLQKPFKKKLGMLGLGGSVGTSEPDGITAEAIVVNSFDELNAVSDKVLGKIVVFNEDWLTYSDTVSYRESGAAKAGVYGAVATLIRSVTPFSLNSPHTGTLTYSEDVKKIPSACITVEDAHLLRRIYDSGEQLIINIYMEARILPNTTSRNTVSEIKGTQKPEKVVIVSGHLDNWDIGQGASDDGGGAFISWCALALLRNLKLIPRRTLRSILWTAEEQGYIGALAYAKQHSNETKNFNFIMDSDEGTSYPWGLKFTGSDQTACILEEILKLLKQINAEALKRLEDGGSNVTVWSGSTLQRASLLNRNEKYFWYYHSEADTIDVVDSDELDRCLIVWATVAYIVADLSSDLPRE